MKRTIKAFGIITLMAVIGFGVVACDDGGGGGGPKGEYHLRWGQPYSATWSDVESKVTSEGWTMEDESDTAPKWKLSTGATAIAIYNYCQTLGYADGGDVDGTFEQCLAFSKNGITGPAGLKAAAETHKDKAPLGGMFDSGYGFVILLYITKN